MLWRGLYCKRTNTKSKRTIINIESVIKLINNNIQITLLNYFLKKNYLKGAFILRSFMINYNVITVPINFTNSAIIAESPGHAGDVTKFPSTTALSASTAT